MNHACEAIIVTCMDFRFQKFINQWIEQNCPTGTFDRASWAGSIKNFDAVLGQIEISKRLHQTKKVILVNHEDCGAYGAAGTPEKHIEDLKNAKAKIQEQFPDLTVDTYYLHMDGTFQPIN